MNTVTQRERERLVESQDHTSPPVNDASAVPGAQRAEAPPSDATLHGAIERLPVSPDMTAFYAQLRRPSPASPSPLGRAASQAGSVHAPLVSPPLGSAREVAVQQRLDAFRDRFAGPYTVTGQTVTALPMFRMNHELSGNAMSAIAHAPELAKIGAKAGLSAAVVAASAGRCTPQQLVKVTQALLDAGKLPAADANHPSLGSRIRGMQWEWGIGVDCAGYTQQAAAEAHGKAGAIFMSNVTGDVFSSMMHDKRFQSVMVSGIRAGDVIHLDSPVSGQVGHNVVVHSHTTLDGPGRQRLLAGQVTDMGGTAFLGGKGPFHAIEVDSSWGAGKAGAMYGGFRRDTWVYDESSFTWASFPVGDRTMPLQVYPDTGPQDELFGGAFRPKDAA